MRGGPDDHNTIRERAALKKNSILMLAINVDLPDFAAEDIVVATRFALLTLEDIRDGENPHLEPLLRAKAKALGIDLDFAA